jgi:hypothetical protein
VGPVPNNSKKNQGEEEEVRSWLAEQGYPLEVRVAKIFAKHEFGVLQGEHYLDPNEEKFRETDVIAQKLILSPEKKAQIRLQFVVECKSLPLIHKWLLFSGEHKALRPPNIIKLSKDARNLFSNLASITELGTAGILRGTFNWGYSLSVSDRQKNDDLAYRALAAVTSAAINWKDPPLGLFAHPSAGNIHIRIPLIVINRSLYLVSLDNKNELRLKKEGMGYVAFRSGGGFEGQDVFILTEEILDKFIVAILKELSTVLAACDKKPGLFLIEAIKTKEFIDSLKDK